MRWFETPDFDFIRTHKITNWVSIAMVIISVGAMLVLGLNYGIDFRGGKEYVLQFEQPVDVVEIRGLLTEPLDAQPEVRLYGSENEIMIRTDAEGDITAVRGIIESTLSQELTDNSFTTIKTDVVGPRLALEQRKVAYNSVLFALVYLIHNLLITYKTSTV